MRVAFFVPSFPVVSETFILRQISGLIDRGHDVDVFAEFRPPEDHSWHPGYERYDLRRRTVYTDDMPAASGYWEMPVRPLWGRTWLPGAERPLWNMRRVCEAVPTFLRCLRASPGLTLEALDRRRYGARASSLSALYRMANLCPMAGRYDVLHAHFGPQGNTFRFARRLLGAPLVVTFHGYDFSMLPRQEGPGLYDDLFATADLVTVNCEYARSRVEELGCSAHKIRRLNMGLELEGFPFRERRAPSDGPVRVLTVGRLVEKKGIEVAVRAVAEARVRIRRPVHYQIIGDGPLRSRLEAVIAELGLQGVVELLGARTGDHVRRAMDEAHLFVLTSVTSDNGDQEGTPVSLMEAQSCGLPVLSTWHSGIPEVVLDGQTGFLVAERDVSAAADRLAHLIEHPELWPDLGRAGRHHVERNYDVTALNGELEALYRGLLAPSHANVSQGSENLTPLKVCP